MNEKNENSPADEPEKPAENADSVAGSVPGQDTEQSPPDPAIVGAEGLGTEEGVDFEKLDMEWTGPDPLEELQKENADLKDRLVRAMAELENTRRRAERERTDAQRYGAVKFARDICEVSDNLRRAVEAAPEPADNEALASLLEGIGITEKSLTQIFERHGVKRVEAAGQKFDPNLHEAMTEIEVPGVDPGVVIQVLEEGYVIHDRLLRHARVIVNKRRSGTAPKVDTSA